MPGEITSALRRIKSQNVNIIEDKAKVCAMLNDLEPSMHKERRRVRLLYETGAIHSIAKAVSNPEGARLYLSQAVNILTDQADMTHPAAAETVNYFVPLWDLPAVEGKTDPAAGLDTDAIFDMMAKADNEKKARAARRNNAAHAGGAQKNAANTKAPVYGQRRNNAAHAGGAGNIQNNPAFTQPLRKAGRLYGTNAGAGGQNAAQSSPQQKQRRIYGSAARNGGAAPGAGQTGQPNYNNPSHGTGQPPIGAGIPSGTGQPPIGAGIFARRKQTPAWKNIAVSVRQNGGASQSVSSLTAAQQASEDLCRFYRPHLAADGSDVRRADKLCRKGMLLTAFAPSRAVKCFMEAAAGGDVAHLSLVGRQILAWQEYLELEAAMGFACLQMAVDRGAECGAYALAHCYHTGTGILKCNELAEKYYRQAAVRHPEITDQINRRIEQLHRGQLPTDSLWRYY